MSFELKISVKTSLSNKFSKIQRALKNIPKEAFNEFVKVTPVRSGNAKRNTKLKGNKIEANYPYAGVLDKGRHMTNRGMRGSDQAPDGMTKPTVDFIHKRVRQIIRGR